MKFENNINYCILANNVNKDFLNKFSSYQIIEFNLTYDELIKKLEFLPTKQIVFNESWYSLKNNEIDNIKRLLKLQNISFIYITSNIEYALYSDYIYVYDDKSLVLEGPTKEVLNNEKKLKNLGYGLPFVVDLSTQLKVYEVLNKTHYNLDTLMEDLWN